MATQTVPCADVKHNHRRRSVTTYRARQVYIKPMTQDPTEDIQVVGFGEWVEYVDPAIRYKCMREEGGIYEVDTVSKVVMEGTCNV